MLITWSMDDAKYQTEATVTGDSIYFPLRSFICAKGGKELKAELQDWPHWTYHPMRKPCVVEIGGHEQIATICLFGNMLRILLPGEGVPPGSSLEFGAFSLKLIPQK